MASGGPQMEVQGERQRYLDTYLSGVMNHHLIYLSSILRLDSIRPLLLSLPWKDLTGGL